MLIKQLAVTSVMVTALVAGYAQAGDDKDLSDKSKAAVTNHDLASSSRIKADWVDALNIQDADKAEEVREIQASYWDDKKKLEEELSELEDKKDKKLQKVLTQEELGKLQALSADTQ